MHQNSTIKTIEEAIDIVAYNDDFCSDINLKNKAMSLSMARWTWTEKQGKLAIYILKQCEKNLAVANIDISELLKTPVFESTFRVIDKQKYLKVLVPGNRKCLVMKFPYQEKLVNYMRCIKKRVEGTLIVTFDQEEKHWILDYADTTLYWCFLLAVRYDFEILDDIAEDFYAVQLQKKAYKKPYIDIDNILINFNHVDPAVEQNFLDRSKGKPFLQRVDMLKDYCVDILHNHDITNLTKKIAFAQEQFIAVDRSLYPKDAFVKAHIDLNLFPCLMVGTSLIQNEDIDELLSWIEAWRNAGIMSHQICFSSQQALTWRSGRIIEDEYKRKLKDIFHWIGNINTQPNEKTKIFCIDTRFNPPMKKDIDNLQSSFPFTETSFWPTSSDFVNKVVDNIPKRLYYVTDKRNT